MNACCKVVKYLDEFQVLFYIPYFRTLKSKSDNKNDVYMNEIPEVSSDNKEP